MANTCTSLHYHIVLSTKNRHPWIHETFPALSGFEWQQGYGAFTVSRSQLPDVIHYVAHQRAHHGIHTFQDEYRALLERHEVEYDERYLWG
jgi:hypothetical protein